MSDTVTLDDLLIKNPATVAIAGVTCSGKTKLLTRMLLNQQKYFDKPFHKIYFVYTQYQNLYDSLKNRLGDSIEFIHGWKTELIKDLGFSERRGENVDPICLVLDDVMEEVCSKRENLKLFTTTGHHANLVIL